LADFWDTVTPEIPVLGEHGIIVRRTSLVARGVGAAEFPVAAIQQREGTPDFGAAVRSEGIHGSVGRRRTLVHLLQLQLLRLGPGAEVSSEPYRKPDPARAKQLLAEAGYAGQPIIIVGTPYLPIVSALSQVMAERLRDIGMKGRSANGRLGDGVQTGRNARSEWLAPVEPGRHLLAGRHLVSSTD
jgi:hypothetical protein